MMNLHAKSCLCEYVMFLCKIDELMKLWLLNYEWIRDYLLLIMFWNMLLTNWCNEYAYWWIDDESCCCWKVV